MSAMASDLHCGLVELREEREISAMAIELQQELVELRKEVALLKSRVEVLEKQNKDLSQGEIDKSAPDSSQDPAILGHRGGFACMRWNHRWFSRNADVFATKYHVSSREVNVDDYLLEGWRFHLMSHCPGLRAAQFLRGPQEVVSISRERAYELRLAPCLSCLTWEQESDIWV